MTAESAGSHETVKHRRREIAKSDYYDRVVEVRRRYPLLSLKAWQWVEG